MANGPLAYGLQCASEKYFDRENVQTINTEADLRTAMQQHGLDYTVSMHEIPHPLTGKPSGFYSTVRDDNGLLLGCGLTDRYHPIQNKAGFSLIADLATERGGLVFARGMTFDGGRVAIAQIDLGEMVIGEGRNGFKDRVRKRITWTNSHDGSGSAKVFTTPIRIVCANTLTAAISGKRDGVSIKHTETAQDRMDQARHLLKIVNGELKRTEATYQALAYTKITNKHIQDVLRDLFPTEGLTAEVGGKTRKEAVEAIQRFKNEADGGRLDPDSGWNFYNAVTRYTDHFSPIRIHGEDKGEIKAAETRTASTLTGSIAEKNGKALKSLVKVLSLDSDIDRMLAQVETSQAMQIATSMEMASKPVPAAQGSLIDWMLQ